VINCTILQGSDLSAAGVDDLCYGASVNDNFDTAEAMYDTAVCSDSLDDDFDTAGAVSLPEPAAAAAGEKSSSVYLSIISQQTFIGCWKLNTELSNLLHVSLDQLQSSAPVKVSHFICSLGKKVAL